MWTHFRHFTRQRWLLAALLGLSLWSSGVAVAATAMGCCAQAQACCSFVTVVGGSSGSASGNSSSSCANCVPMIGSTVSTLPIVAPYAPTVHFKLPLQTSAQDLPDVIWRPPIQS